MKIAFGCKMGVGKDTAVKYLIEKYGGEKIAFSTPIYDILHYAQSLCGFSDEKDREFLQYIGTEWGRRKDPDVWVKLALKNVSETNTNIYISDLRFLNEFDYLKNNGWKCVKIVRKPLNDRKGTGSETHISETSLDNQPDDRWDYILTNNGTVEEFYESIDNMITDFISKFLNQTKTGVLEKKIEAFIVSAHLLALVVFSTFLM